MIFWDNFDKAATRVFCDNCAKDITDLIQKAFKTDKVFGINTVDYLKNQWSFKLFGFKFVVMRFKSTTEKPAILRNIYFH